MAATTTEVNTYLPQFEKMVLYSTNFGQSSDATGEFFGTAVVMSTAKNMGGFGIATTGGDVIRFPINYPGSKAIILAIYNSAVSTGTYPHIAIRKAQTGGWGGLTTDMPANVLLSPSSLTKSGWKWIISTAQNASSTESAMYTIALPDTLKYAQYSATSTYAIDKYQTYIEIMPGISTAAPRPTALHGTTCTFAALSTTGYAYDMGGCHLAFIEVP